MLLYDLENKFYLFDFGIKIPIMEDKIFKTIEYLRQFPAFEEASIPKISDTLTREDLERVHSKEYVERLFSTGIEAEIIKIFELVDAEGNYHRYNPEDGKFPLKFIFNQELIKAAGSFQCTKVALEKGFCFYFGGGAHHAKNGYGEGFCMINDIVIAIKRLQSENRIKEAWVIDVDAHKGDGTAALTQEDDSIKTLSIHMAHGWPLDGQEFINGEMNPSFLPSDVEIPIEVKEENVYIQKLKEGLLKLETLSKPQLAVIVLGADPYEKDELLSTSLIKLTLEQMMERDILIYEFLKARNIPQAYLMAGGYGSECWQVYAQFLEYVFSEAANSI